MGYGLFGKVPQKRDFLSVNMPTAVLTPFETWLQAGVAASRNELGRAWEEHYLVSPIWRFWIGDLILGTTVAGALMPSVDGVGRYFPLSIMYFAEPNDTLPPPLLSPLDHWYSDIEQRLLAALSEETDGYLGRILEGLQRPYELQSAPFEMMPNIPEVPVEGASSAPADVIAETGEEAGDLPPPETIPEPAPVVVDDLPDTSPFDDFPPTQGQAAPPITDHGPQVAAFRGGQTVVVPPGETLDTARFALRDADYRHAAAGRSYFWCAPSRMGPARIHSRQGLPDPYYFSQMIAAAAEQR